MDSSGNIQTICDFMKCYKKELGFASDKGKAAFMCIVYACGWCGGSSSTSTGTYALADLHFT